ncbi:biotin--[acetyl-CoA-carboxylase] ligase [Candidatus Galacturonibacter soehngenii]|uniref:Bifunctional ligase/repressor BirA n=1 Tax=Candidatus Galacturonatibacter soehngenii TaxID=2307010 RepID=A0A7V7UA45_9FIRM|nr:biotin--[acetyl-CoA-carboxylase] ligase [Candidatus Galacturonibacter soehngenii]KAB1434304.1 biotin--[acetyl-CoA-carboxylase] ligase [Candidatus Galacturonibacter soehngenii]
MKTQILTLLKEADTYISGQDICTHFGVSRTAVWKAINQLKKEGYVIEAVPNKGYYLKTSPDIISYSEMKSVLNTKWIGEELYFYEEIDSTNTKAKQLAETGATSGTLVVSNMQTAGKGRRGRQWESPSETGIFMTLILKLDMNPSKASMLTLVMALAVVKACNEVTKSTCYIKWPNDIVLNKKKICGILTEMSAEMDYINHIVIGIGINANVDSFPEELKDKATSLKIENGKEVKRAMLINRIMVHFEHEYEIFMHNESMKAQIDEYNEFLINKDKEVTIIEPSNQYQGIALGIDEIGKLLVKKEDGKIEAVYAGEVSVRGIYGYI